MKSPLLRIGTALFACLLLAALAGLAFGGVNGLWVVLLLPVGMVLGPPMALSYPFDLVFKIGYVLALLTALGLIIGGGWRRSATLGQACVVAGFILWAFAGLIGLSTGT